jgi:methionine-gamma-lyase
MNTKDKGFHTKLVHAGAPKDPSGSVVTPIYQTSTFAFENTQVGADRFAGKADGFIYTRIGNPTIRALEDCVAELEEGVGGVATSSGMGAVTTVCLTLLARDEHVISTASVYGPSRTLMEKHLGKFGVSSSFVDTSDLPAVGKAFRESTRLVYVETPSNPMMQITNIAAVAQMAHEHGALLAVDSTFASPYLQKPLTLGADVVLHSVTKFINGHADVVGGILVALDPAVYRRLRETMVITGCNMDPHQAFLVHRGVKTLGLRMERAQQNAIKIARWIESRPEVTWVRFSGLPSHPQYELANRQMKGPGSTISFELKGGLEAGKSLMNNIRLAALAVSLGGVESLIEHPASMTHAGMGPEGRLNAGITDGLVRYSVGIEDVDDLIEDLRQGLAAEQPVRTDPVQPQ